MLTIGAVDLRDLSSLLSRVRRLLDLDADPVAIDATLAGDPRLAAGVAGTPGMRMPGAVDPQELLIRAMIGQQITVAAARTALVQLSPAGSDSPVPADGLHRLFPTAAQIAESGLELLRGPRRRIDSVCGAAAAMASGDLEFGYGDDVPGLEAKLLPLAGVGPWTVGYVAMRVIGAPDVFLANDAAVRNGIRALAPATRAGPALTPDFRDVSPWRSYATMHLWRAAAASRRAHAQPLADLTDARPRRKRCHESPAVDHVHPGRSLHHHCPGRHVLASGWTAVPGETDRPDPPRAAARRVRAVTGLGGSPRPWRRFMRAIPHRPWGFRCCRSPAVSATTPGTCCGTVAPGRPVTYTEYAELSGNAKAVRAAASACAFNAAALFVPCHRVIRTDGTLGGFRWGLASRRACWTGNAKRPSRSARP